MLRMIYAMYLCLPFLYLAIFIFSNFSTFSSLLDGGLCTNAILLEICTATFVAVDGDALVVPVIRRCH